MNSQPDRRLVLRRLAQAGILAGGTGLIAALGYFSPGRWRGKVGLKTIPDHRVPTDPRFPPLAVAAGSDPALMVRAALGAVGGIGRFVHPGETVLLKPNAAWDRSPEQGANTHPAVVAEVVRQCRSAGAKRIVVAENPVHDARRCAQRSGILAAVSAAGGEYVFPSGSGFTWTALGGTVLDSWEVMSVVFSADRLINLPVVKDHALSVLTCGLKNSYGLVGGTRARLHQDLHAAIADLAAAFRPTLTIVDATRVMVRGGPTGGRLEDVITRNRVAAGTDPVALDAWAARQLDRDPRDIPHISLAEGKGLGSLAAGLAVREIINAGS